MLITLSGQTIIIAYPSVSGFEGLIQKFEVNVISMNVHGKWDIGKEYSSFIAWLFQHRGLLYMMVGL